MTPYSIVVDRDPIVDIGFPVGKVIKVFETPKFWKSFMRSMKSNPIIFSNKDILDTGLVVE